MKYSPHCPDGFRPISRAAVRRLAGGRAPISTKEARATYGLCVPFVQNDVSQVYWPLARIAAQRSGAASRPRILAIAGSVAAGKSTVARLLTLMLGRLTAGRVAHVSTDAFLLPNDELRRRRLLERKGYPETYDWDAMSQFLTALRAGVKSWVPVYSHLENDRVPRRYDCIENVSVLVLEGLNALSQGSPLYDPSEVVDFGLFIDAAPESLEKWYVERFLALRRMVFVAPNAYFARYAGLSKPSAVSTAKRIWRKVNEPNLKSHVLPTRDNADVIIHLAQDHTVEAIFARAQGALARVFTRRQHRGKAGANGID